MRGLPLQKLTSFVLAAALWAAPAMAALELGRVDADKVKSFAEYFEPYLGKPNIVFEDAAFGEKIVSEARGIHAWIEDEANWPPEPKITAEMLADTGRLYACFAHAGFEGAGEAAVRRYRQSVEKDPANFDTQFRMAELLSEMGGVHSLEGAMRAESAIGINPAEAASRNAYYIAALGFYNAGFFRKGREYLKKQLEIDPDYENTSDLDFVFERWVSKWGEIPEKVTFEENQAGDLVPVPAG